MPRCFLDSVFADQCSATGFENGVAATYTAAAVARVKTRYKIMKCFLRAVPNGTEKWQLCDYTVRNGECKSDNGELSGAP